MLVNIIFNAEILKLLPTPKMYLEDFRKYAFVKPLRIRSGTKPLVEKFGYTV